MYPGSFYGGTWCTVQISRSKVLRKAVKHVSLIGADWRMYGTVLLLRCCCKLESRGTVLLFYCCKLRSCIVVLLYCCLFLCWLGKSSTVLFLVVSGKSSTVLAVLYCFLTWYTNLRTRKQKRNESLQSSKLVHSSSAIAFQNCPSDPMLSGRYRSEQEFCPH